MPLKLNVAVSRKVGEPNYGSKGASVGFELEVDSTLVDQPRQLHARIARMFRLAKHSVDRELAGVSAETSERLIRAATPAQVRVLHAIARSHELDLAAELHSRFGVEQAEELSLVQASELIDSLKTQTSSDALPQT